MGIIYVILGVPAKQMVRIAISLTVAYNGYVEIWAREFGSSYCWILVTAINSAFNCGGFP